MNPRSQSTLLPTHPTVVAAFLLLLGAGYACSSSESVESTTEVKSIVPSVGVADLEGKHPTIHPAPPEKPACLPVVTDQGRVSLNGVDMALNVQSKTGLAVFPLDNERILLAKRKPIKQGAWARPNGILWVVPCNTPLSRTLFLKTAGADFGNGVVSKSRRSLLFVSRQGIERLNLEQKTTELLLKKSPKDPDCWALNDKSNAQQPHQRILGLTPDGALKVEEGASCGRGGSWVGWRKRVATQESGHPGAVRQPRPISTVAQDSRGWLYVGDGGRCDEPGIQDYQTPGVIFRSRDKGKAWLELPVIADDSRMHTATKTILADAKRPGLIVVLGAMCRTPLGNYGGLLYTSRNAGRAWKLIRVPDSIGETTDGGYAVERVALRGGSIDRLYIWNRKGERYLSLSSGLRWKRAPATEATAPPAQARNDDGDRFDATGDGLRHTASDGSSQILQPTRAAIRAKH
jgi:hypothetical protein